MSNEVKHPRNISRRDTLKACLVPAAGVLTSHWLIGCSSAGPKAAVDNPLIGSSGHVAAPATSGSPASPPATAGAKATAGMGPAAMSGGASGTTTTAGSSATAGAGGGPTAGAQAGAGGSAGAIAGPGVAWATGGTKSMQGNYPDPFGSASAGTQCVIYPSQTLGPCYAQTPMMRTDISDAMDGLPVRLSFLLVRSAGCRPVPNATIDIWHSGSGGFYSAYATGTVCNPGSMDVRSQMFGRGVQTTDANGRADFSSVFPGWYNGRSIHIHFTVRLNGQESVTSQLYFEDPLTEEILAQGLYKARGKRDTTNATDTTFRSGGASPEQVVLSTAKRPDGVLHAWKVLSVG